MAGIHRRNLRFFYRLSRGPQIFLRPMGASVPSIYRGVGMQKEKRFLRECEFHVEIRPINYMSSEGASAVSPIRPRVGNQERIRDVILLIWRRSAQRPPSLRPPLGIRRIPTLQDPHFDILNGAPRAPAKTPSNRRVLTSNPLHPMDCRKSQ